MLELVQTMRDSMCDHPDAERLVLELAAQLGTACTFKRSNSTKTQSIRFYGVSERKKHINDL